MNRSLKNKGRLSNKVFLTILWKIKVSTIPTGKQKRKRPYKVCPISPLISILKKYSKSGVKLPITKPVKENHCLCIRCNGKMIAGCENVKGIKIIL